MMYYLLAVVLVIGLVVIKKVAYITRDMNRFVEVSSAILVKADNTTESLKNLVENMHAERQKSRQK
jgi:hypothetical protein